MSFRRMLAGLTFLAIFAMAMRVSVANDTWWHLRAGAWMLDHGALLRSDPFSLTRLGQPWIYPGWASQLLMVQIFRAAGLPGLNLLTAAAVVVAFGFVWRATEAPPLLKAFVFVLGATVSGVFWSARPQILSFAMTGVFFWALRRARRSGPRALWLPVALMAVWANLHGGFVIGWILLGIELVSSSLDSYLPEWLRLTDPEPSAVRPAQWGLALLLGALAVSLNPAGPQLLAYPFRTVSISTLQNYIQEWQSPDFHQLELQPFLWMLLLTGGALALSPKRPYWRELLIAGAFAALGLTAGRNVALFGLLATPLLARHLQAIFTDRLPQRPERRQLPLRLTRAVNLALLLLVGAAVALKSVEPLRASVNQAAVAEQAPVEAVEFLREHEPPGPLFNSYNWGSYVLWELYPDYLSFVDGRTDLFDDQVLEQYLAIWRADAGWQAQLMEWGIQLVLVEPGAPLSVQLQSSGWITLYQDSMSIVLAHPG